MSYKDANFIRELFLMAYILSEATFPKEFYKFRLTKILTNYIQDWKEVTEMAYKPYALFDPHPFGMVSMIKSEEGSDKKGNMYVFKKEFLNIGESNGLWETLIIQDRKTKVKIKIPPHELRNLLLDGVQDSQFPVIYRFSDPLLLQAKGLAEIYKRLDTEELNILATHRNKHNSESCLRRVTRLWFTNCGRIISWISVSRCPDYFIDVLADMMVFSIQIIKKIEQIKIGMPSVIEKLKTIESQLSDTSQSLSRAILNKLENSAPHLNNVYIGKIDNHYVKTLQYILPIQDAVLKLIINKQICKQLLPYVKQVYKDFALTPQLKFENINEIEIIKHLESIEQALKYASEFF